jgi:hypothetical protein
MREIEADLEGRIPEPQAFASRRTATAQESVTDREDRKTRKSQRQRRIREEQVEDDEPSEQDEESVDEERPGAIAVGGAVAAEGHFDDVTVQQDDSSAESPGTIMDDNLPIAAELVEIDDGNKVSEIVALLMRQIRLRERSTPSEQASDGDPISRPNASTTVQAAVVIETKRICGVPRIWVLVGVLMLILLLSSVSIAVGVSSGSSNNGATEITTSNPTLAPTTPGVLFQQDIQGERNRDFFGQYIEFSRDESTAAIGAPGSDPYVQVFRKTAGSSVWEMIGQTIEGNDDAFGSRLDLNEDGNTLVIGAPKNDEMGNNAGLVRVYKYNGSDSWVQIGQDVELVVSPSLRTAIGDL